LAPCPSRAARPGEARRPARSKVVGPDGVERSFHFAARVLRVHASRKISVYPSVEAPANQSDRHREIRLRGRRAGLWLFRALTLLWRIRVLAPWPRRDGFRRPSRRGDGVTARARDVVPTRAPPADGRRESAASGLRSGGAVPREGPASRLRGRKTLASLSGQAAARTAAPRRETDGERRRHTTPQARVGDGNGRRDRHR
jgi:hypothetical protein